MFKIFSRKNSAPPKALKCDLHSHLLPGLDDGVESFEESIEIINGLKTLGYSKIITTPHVMHDFYNNSSEDILHKLEQLKQLLKEQNIDIEVEASAEYYLDEQLINIVAEKPIELLTFGDNYFLFETSFMTEPLYMKEFIFEAKSKGLNPILAHPERYVYLQEDLSKVEDLINRGVLMQLNINSLSGYYSKRIKKTAEKLIDAKQVHLIGSDCHNIRHFGVMKKSRQEKYYKKAVALPLINDSL